MRFWWLFIWNMLHCELTEKAFPSYFCAVLAMGVSGIGSLGAVEVEYPLHLWKEELSI